MPVKTEVYLCIYCATPYNEEKEAIQCELSHSAPEQLEVSDARGFDEHSRFPQKILIADTSYSGVLAEYEKIQESSMEDFYERRPWMEEEHKLDIPKHDLMGYNGKID